MDISKEVLERIRAEFPIGSRIELILMDDDPNPLPAGSRGTVRIVDDWGTIHVNWDSGRRLGLVYGVDIYKRI